MQCYEVKWFQKGNEGTMLVKWWLENGSVKVQLNGDIPNVPGIHAECLSKRCVRECYELVYADEIERRINDLGYDLSDKVWS